MWRSILFFFTFNFTILLIGCSRMQTKSAENKPVNQKKVSSKSEKQEELTKVQKEVIEELTSNPKKDIPVKDTKKTDKILFEPVLDTIKENKAKEDLIKPILSPKLEVIEEIQQEIVEFVYLDNKISDYLNNTKFTKIWSDNLIYFSDSINNTINIRNQANNFFDIFIDSSEDLNQPKGIEFIEYLNSEKISEKFKDTSILVADSDNYVWEFYGPDYGNSQEDIEKRGKYRGIYSSGKMENPQDILLTPSGDLLVASADNHKVLCYAGPNQENQGEFKKELFSLEEINGKPSKLYLDSKENKLYVKDIVHNKIETFNY